MTKNVRQYVPQLSNSIEYEIQTGRKLKQYQHRHGHLVYLELNLFFVKELSLKLGSFNNFH